MLSRILDLSGLARCGGVRGGICLALVVVLAALRSAQAANCYDCFVFPNVCPTDRQFNWNNWDDNVNCGTGTNTCCSSGSSCSLVSSGAAGCCSWTEAYCNDPGDCSGSNKRYLLSTSDVSRMPRNSNSRCTASGCTGTATTYTCPANYQLSVPFSVSFSDSVIRYCTPDNCNLVTAGDCTTCVSCVTGFGRIPDGSCQLFPLLTAAVRAPSNSAINSMICTPNVISLNTDPGRPTTNVTVGGVGSPRGFQAYGTALATMTNVSCWATRTAAFNLPGGDNPRSIALGIGMNVLTCQAVDSNGLNTTCSNSINVTDIEPPVALCGNLSIPANPSNANSLFTWSRVPNATDNVNVSAIRSVCSGGPINNIFTFGTPVRITCAAYDTSNNNNNCSYFINVVDRTAPVLSCPAAATFNTTLNSNTRTHTYVVGVLDNVEGSSPAVSCSHPSGSQFLIGTTVVSCQATDSSGNRGTCSFNVTITDRQPPTLNCPTVFSPSSDNTVPTATVFLPTTATDNSLAPVSISCTPGGLPSAFTFPLGTTAATCVATDLFGNQNSCSFSVDVVDRVKPVLTCPTATLTSLPGRNFSNISSYPASATDNVNVVSFSCTPLTAGFRYPIGDTSASCTASDAQGNSESCSFTVSVADGEPPVVVCPPNVRYGTVASANITVNFTRPLSSDNLAVTSTSLVATFNGVDLQIATNASNSIFNYTFPTWGTAALTFRAFDAAGHTGLCFWTITTYDRTLGSDEIPPVITGCPTPFQFTQPVSSDFDSPMYNSSVVILPQYNTSQGKDHAIITLAALSATDNSGVAPTVSYLEWSVNPSSASLGVRVGKHVVAYSATDRLGNTAYCVYRIIVADTIAPQIETCPASRTLATSSSRTTVNPTTANFWPTTGIRFTDNLLPMANPNGTCTSVPAGFCPSPGTPLNVGLGLGTYNFTYTAVDEAGNQARPCQFSLTIVDGDPPVLSGCPPSLALQINTNTDPGSSFANIASLCPNFSATDNFPNTSLIYSSAPQAGLNCQTPIPVTTAMVITVMARDASGLTSTPCFIVVSVRDNEPPVLQGCSPNSTLVINAVCDPGQRTAVVWLPTITAQDNTNSTTFTLSSFPTGYVNGSAFPMGSVTLTLKAFDANRLSTPCDIEVRVRDTQPPVIVGFPSNTSTTFTYIRNTSNGLATASFTPPTLTATDNVGIQSTSLSSDPSVSGNEFPVGTTTLTFVAYDTSSLNASVTIYVVVQDFEPPEIVACPTVGSTPLVLTYNTSHNLPSTVVQWPPVSAHDNVDGDFSLSSTSSPPGYESGSPFRVGTTTITYEAVDIAGNTAKCVFHVQIVDNQSPQITCPDNFTMTTPSAEINYAELTWPSPVATDNYHLLSVEPNVYPNQNFSLGSYNITYLAIDMAGNTNSCTFFATVLQLVPAASTAAASSSTATVAAAAGAGSLLILLVLLVLLVVLTRRRNKKKLDAAASGYAELMKMSDDFILERAKSIQDALMEQRMASPPAAVNAQYIHPERKFTAPPAGLAALEDYMRSTVNKELSRDFLEFGAELGAGEFGAVYEGFYLRPNPKLKVAIKMLKKATSDDDKCRFLKEAAIMAQFNHPNICSLVGVCTLPTTEPTLIVLEYMHLGALHGYLQSPMVFEKLETLTMLRMALDIGCGMQYLAEAGFVHRDLAARNILLDKTMTCRVGDFGLSVDLSEGQGEDNGVYSGQEGAKIPIRWTAIEAVCFRQFSTASDVWSYGILLWEIWSYAELPYRGWSNKKVTEEVSSGFRLPKPAQCPDEVYRIMIDCWNKNVKRRTTFPKINEALVEIWHDITRGDRGGNDSDEEKPAEDEMPADGNMLYDNSATQMAPDSSDEDDGPSSPVVAAAVAAAPNPAVAEGEVVYQADEPMDRFTMVGNAEPPKAKAAAPAQEPVQDDEDYDFDEPTDMSAFAINLPSQQPKAAAAAAAPAPAPAAAVPAADPIYLYSSTAQSPPKAQAEADSNYVTDLKELTKNVNVSKDDSADIYTENGAVQPVLVPTPRPAGAPPMQIKSRDKGISTANVGERVIVKDFGQGTLRFFGPHAKDGKPRCGVQLDEPKGLNNGTAGGHKYFECEMKYGVLVDPRVVLLVEAKPTGIMFNPIYDSVTIFRPSLFDTLASDDSAERAAQRSGYLQIGENLEP